MRIVFIGAVEFSKHCLIEIIKNDGNVVAVFTIEKNKSTQHSDYTNLSEVASQYEIAVHGVKNINDPESVSQILALKPDVIFVFGWSQLISEQILDIPALGCIGTHPALLPKNRGRHPIIWSLVEGLKESGLSFFYIDEGTDSGDILWQRPFPISLEDDAGAVYDKIKVLASEAIKEFLPQLKQGTAPRIPQDHSKASYWLKRTEKNGEIYWASQTMKTYNLIRALAHPYVGAHTYLNGEKIIIWRSKLQQNSLPSEAISLQPGTIFSLSDKEFDIRTGDGYLTVTEYEFLGDVLLDVGIQLG